MMHKIATEQVWDRVVRSTHWLIAAAVVGNLFVLDSGRLHRWLGYAIMALMLLRCLWGFVGSQHARFSDWWPAPSRLLPYLKLLLQGREPRMLGHNPAGALMMLLLWLLLAALGVSGFMMGTDTFFGEEWLQDVHAGLSIALQVCVLLHVLAALFESWKHRENLIASMISGHKRRQ